ncbi:MAG: DUF393 domain-containing protein [Phycisphaeraceae bacterium]|nr:DUF393 domain-containing protein [Phycisphaeraceae bacterium]MBX3363106.1 DUF393 domain-containing protein [Phycisphaeraceae bacterium]MBX3368050.1 DUF393 domain-containing protein [Phycisphaeraceae bacterium]
MHDSGPILFYDGDCGLCNRSVRWVIRRDRSGSIRYAPLQGETYRDLELPEKPQDLSSMVYLDRGVLSTRSDATVRVLGTLGGGWAVVSAALRLIPRPIRDWAYLWFAKRRHRFTPGACPMPDPTLLSRTLP